MMIRESVKRLTTFAASMVVGVGIVGACAVLCVVAFVVLYFGVVFVASVRARLGVP
jgi:hypothetical protein